MLNNRNKLEEVLSLDYINSQDIILSRSLIVLVNTTLKTRDKID
jgi:hypothetical protein